MAIFSEFRRGTALRADSGGSDDGDAGHPERAADGRGQDPDAGGRAGAGGGGEVQGRHARVQGHRREGGRGGALQRWALLPNHATRAGSCSDNIDNMTRL